MVYHVFYPLMEVKCYTNDGRLMGLGFYKAIIQNRQTERVQHSGCLL